MNTKHALFGVALLTAAAASPAFAQRSTAITAPAARYSLLGGTTVPTGVDVASAEVGWPSASFGFTHGMSPTTDVGFKFDLIWGFENTTTSQFGLGFRVPLRANILRRDRLTALVHIDPGLKVYTTSPANFGLQFPVGVTLSYAAAAEYNIGFGVDLPMTLMLTPSPVRFYLGPLFGPEIEYHIDRQLTVGVNTRFGPVFLTNNGASEFGLVMQVLLAYRL
jgi:hypothetical protein